MSGGDPRASITTTDRTDGGLLRRERAAIADAMTGGARQSSFALGTVFVVQGGFFPLVAQWRISP
jgi:hypothetical protein